MVSFEVASVDAFAFVVPLPICADFIFRGFDGIGVAFFIDAFDVADFVLLDAVDEDDFDVAAELLALRVRR